MAKRKALKRRRGKRVQKKKIKKLPVKKKFVQGIMRLKRMSPTKQRAAVLGSSSEFIRDVSGVLKRLRHRSDLVKATHRKVLRKHAPKLRKLIHPKTQLENKRLILSQRGGILPALIPIIVAGITAGGGIAAAATSAAIMKS